MITCLHELEHQTTLLSKVLGELKLSQQRLVEWKAQKSSSILKRELAEQEKVKAAVVEKVDISAVDELLKKAHLVLLEPIDKPMGKCKISTATSTKSKPVSQVRSQITTVGKLNAAGGNTKAKTSVHQKRDKSNSDPNADNLKSSSILQKPGMHRNDLCKTKPVVSKTVQPLKTLAVKSSKPLMAVTYTEVKKSEHIPHKVDESSSVEAASLPSPLLDEKYLQVYARNCALRKKNKVLSENEDSANVAQSEFFEKCLRRRELSSLGDNISTGRNNIDTTVVEEATSNHTDTLNQFRCQSDSILTNLLTLQSDVCLSEHDEEEIFDPLQLGTKLICRERKLVFLHHQARLLHTNGNLAQTILQSIKLNEQRKENGENNFSNYLQDFRHAFSLVASESGVLPTCVFEDVASL